MDSGRISGNGAARCCARSEGNVEAGLACHGLPDAPDSAGLSAREVSRTFRHGVRLELRGLSVSSGNDCLFGHNGQNCVPAN